jgi:hypothetical protein
MAGKVAIVTGGGRGLGQEVAYRLGAEAPTLPWRREALTRLPRRLAGSKPRVAQHPPSLSTSQMKRLSEIWSTGRPGGPAGQQRRRHLAARACLGDCSG